MNGITVNKTPKQCSEPGQNVLQFMNVDQIKTEEGFRQENDILVGVDYDEITVKPNVEPIQYFLVEEPEKILQGASNSVLSNVFETSECSTTQIIAYDNLKCSNEIENFVSSYAIRNVENNANKTVVDSFEYNLEDVKEEIEDNSYEGMEDYNSDEYNNFEDDVKIEIEEHSVENVKIEPVSEEDVSGLNSPENIEPKCEKTNLRSVKVRKIVTIEKNSEVCLAYRNRKFAKMLAEIQHKNGPDSASDQYSHASLSLPDLEENILEDLKRKDPESHGNNQTNEGTTVESQYECNVRQKTYESSQNCCDHLKKIEERSKLCYVCGEIVNSNLRAHLATHGERWYECTACPRRYQSENILENHKSKHCLYCKKLLATTAELELHLDDHRKFRIPKLYECTVCQKGFHQKTTFLKHSEIHENYNCAVCNLVFETAEDLQTHLKNLYTVVTVSKTKNPLSSGQDHMNAPRARPHQCTFCKKILWAKRTLTAHIKTHYRPKGKLFECKFCCQSVPGESLKDHLNEHGETSYECSLCKKIYSSRVYLEKHRARCKSCTGRVYKCEVCSMMFPYRYMMFKHLKRHRKRPNECKDCEESFESELALEVHQMRCRLFC